MTRERPLQMVIFRQDLRLAAAFSNGGGATHRVFSAFRRACQRNDVVAPPLAFPAPACPGGSAAA